MFPQLKGSDAENSDIPNINYKVLPLDKRMQLLNLKKERKQLCGIT